MNLEHTVIALCGFAVGFAAGCGLIGIIASIQFMKWHEKQRKVIIK